MRLIDADVLMETLGIKEHCEDCQYHHHDVFCNRSCDFVTACEAISDAPTEIIYCKDCGWWNKKEKCCHKFGHNMEDDDFCSLAC